MKKEILTKEPPVDLRLMEEELSSYDRKITSGDLIALLQDTQDACGYLPREALEYMSENTAIPMARIFGVA
ncbi:MAG: NAD(P)H-dependent oxidoreductase subunit E, partial [Candidatus Bathyanammoxibius sp.]